MTELSVIDFSELSLAELEDQAAEVNAMSGSIDRQAVEIVTRKVEVALKSGAILNAAKARAEVEWQDNGFRNLDICFNKFVCRNFQHTPRHTRHNQQKLAAFFADHDIGDIPLSIGYWLASEKPETAEAIYPKLIAHEGKISGKFYKELVAPYKPQVDPKPTTQPEEVIVEPETNPETPAEDTTPLPVVDLPLEAVIKLLPKEHRDAYVAEPGKLPSFIVAGVISNHQRIAKAIAGLSSTESRAVLKAVALLFTAQQPMFDKMFPGYKTKANQALELKLKAKIDEAERARVDYIAGNTVLPGFAFSKSEIKQIRGCLHPDREASAEQKQKAFAVFQRIFAKLK